jgi:hypothetical protein
MALETTTTGFLLFSFFISSMQSTSFVTVLNFNAWSSSIQFTGTLFVWGLGGVGGGGGGAGILL